MGLRARIVHEDETTLTVERKRGPAEEVVQPDDNRLEALVASQAINAVAVLLSEEEIPSPVDRETPEHRLARLAGEGDHDTRHPSRVDRPGPAEIQAIDLTGRVSEPPRAQHDESAAGIERELDRTGNSGGDHFDSEPRRHIDASRWSRIQRDDPRQREQHRRGDDGVGPCQP